MSLPGARDIASNCPNNLVVRIQRYEDRHRFKPLLQCLRSENRIEEGVWRVGFAEFFERGSQARKNSPGVSLRSLAYRDDWSLRLHLRHAAFRRTQTRQARPVSQAPFWFFLQARARTWSLVCRQQ